MFGKIDAATEACSTNASGLTRAIVDLVGAIN